MTSNKRILNNVLSQLIPGHGHSSVMFNNDNVIDLEEDEQESTHSQNIFETNEKIQTVSTQRKFSADVEVETYGDADTNQDSPSIVHPDIIEIDDECSEDIRSNKEEEVFYIRNVLPQCTSTTDSTTTHSSTTTLVKQYTISIESIRKATEAQCKENNNDLDKFLDVATRNSLGQFGTTIISSYDKRVNRVLRFWKIWYEICPRLRDTPLLYKCYLCSKGWWRLHPFKEHLKEHSPDLNLRTETTHHEFYIVACTKQAPKIRDVNIESNCWKCGKGGNFHRYTDELLKYECEGCKQRIVTCSKLKEHESICKDYIELNLKRYNFKANEGKACQICFMYCANQELLNIHLIDRHLVRTDEPIALETKLCKACSGRYSKFNCHDCPRKNKGIKCNICCRKFLSFFFRNIHVHNSKGAIRCMVCGKLMMECLAMEHYVQHTTNYSLLYYCGKCKKKVLFSNQRYFYDHMQHHNLSSARKRWAAWLLLPTKCVNGDIVESETTLTIPNEKLANFICGLEDTDSSTTSTNFLVNRILDDVADKDVTSFNDDALNSAGLLRVAEEKSEKKAGQDRELWTMEAQLDEEIRRDIEMEAEISKVFSTSKSYLKFMEKELMEEELQTKKLKDQQDEHQFDDSLIIDDREIEDVTVISDSESENEEKVEVKTAEKAVSINNDVKTESDLTLTAEKVDFDVSEFKDEIDLEPDDEMYLLSDSERLNWNTSTFINAYDVKDEDYVDDNAVKMETEDSLLIDNVNGEKTENISTEEHEERLRMIANTKVEVESDTEVVNATESIEEAPKVSEAKVYKCKKCIYEGPWSQYIAHAITRCPGTHFNCTVCKREFFDLRFYLDHLVEHGYGHLTCPECQAPCKYPSVLYNHVTTHIRSLYSRGKHIRKAFDKLENYSYFNCKTCNKRVDPEQFLEHWQMNLNGGCLAVNGQAEKFVNEYVRSSEESSSSDDEEDSRMQPHVIQKVLDILRIKDTVKMAKECNVCSKQFKRRNDFKRHLIEHLLVESMMARPTTNNRLKCHFCPKEFLLALAWKQHMREHSFLPAFKCELCSKYFSNHGNLAKHKKVHKRSTNKFICDLCGRIFDMKRSLKQHLKMHETSTLVCCQKIFINESKLREHEVSEHQTILNSYPCTICGKVLLSKKEHLDHMWVKHKHRNVCADCPMCKKPFRRRRDVATHMKKAHKVRYCSKD